jgi:hypothetical protein
MRYKPCLIDGEKFKNEMPKVIEEKEVGKKGLRQ